MRIRCLIYDQVNLLDVAGPAQVFAAAGQLQDDITTTFETCSIDGGSVCSDTGVAVATQRLDDLSGPVDIFLVPGSAAIVAHLEDGDLVGAIRDQAAVSTLVASVCTGSLLLAKAGLLTNKSAAIHWRFVDRLRKSGADICVKEDAIFVEDGAIWTSAGVSSGIDMALALVARFWGRPLALAVAKELVVPMVRSGGQKQFSAVLDLQSFDKSGQFSDLHEWIYENAQADCRVQVLAQKCGMSPRSFARRYRAAVGETPAKAVELIRVGRARDLVEKGEMEFGEIAGCCGFKSVNQLRLSFERIHGVSPSIYRSAFQ
ncbi:MAG: DJ-1/PfpI family protein [Pseudomonadota bacterium]